jgi:Holliday junction resolvase RusA-like endonuclease
MKTSTFESAFNSHVLNFLGPDHKTIFIAVEPAPASRPRISRWGAYYGKNYENYRKQARAFLSDIDGEATSQPLAVVMEVIVSKPKTTKRSSPRGDVDNYAKGPLDSLTEHGGFWDDDDQITCLSVVKRFAEADEQSGIYIHYAQRKD